MRPATGIVHFGPGAFHRAHQADYIDRLLKHDPRWGIAAAALRSAGTVEALKAQGGRYTLAIVDAEPAYRRIAAHTRLLGPGEGAALRAQLADSAVRIVTSTVTEKGYCLEGDGSLDCGHPDIVHDLDRPGTPRSLIGWLALGLADRRAAGDAPFASLCCDNMASNGRKLGGAVTAFAERFDPELARWIASEAPFPNTMVDAITPATTDELRAQVHDATGWADAAPVAREAYAAWIIEDILPPGSPDLAGVGAVLTGDVAAWERAKLRLLNGAHSTLAYAGLLRGHETVAEAMNDPALAGFVERMMLRDIAPTLAPTSLDPDAYVGDVLRRFRNPAIRHRLAQIAWDGSQKLPYRLLDTLADARAAGRSLDRLATAVAAWMLFVRRQAWAGVELVDPLAETLAKAGRAPDAPRELLALRSVFPASLADDPAIRAAILVAADRIDNGGIAAALEEPAFA